MERKKLNAIVPFLIAVAGVGVALWVSGLYISGSFTATSGTQPTQVSFTEDIALTGVDYLWNETFNNPDGDVVMTFTQDVSGVNSTDANCNYEEDVDFVLSVHNGAIFRPLSESPTVDLSNGDNELQFKASPHTNRCALNGSYSITGTVA